MTRYATEAPSGVLVVSDVPLEEPAGVLARAWAAWTYAFRKYCM